MHFFIIWMITRGVSLSDNLICIYPFVFGTSALTYEAEKLHHLAMAMAMAMSMGEKKCRRLACRMVGESTLSVTCSVKLDTLRAALFSAWQ
jgi:hypothetical protein